MERPTWALLSGEYPPQPGGVADYSQLVAHGLARAGDDVHVFSSVCKTEQSMESDITLHRLGSHFGLMSLGRLERSLRQLPTSAKIVVEYTPHAFGYKAMNVPFCLWLASRFRGRYWVMFHEVWFPFVKGQSWKHRLLATATRKMASILANNAERVFISIQQWRPILEQECRRLPPCHWLPVPSNVPCKSDPTRVAAIGESLSSDGDQSKVIGHFGTFDSVTADMLSHVLPSILHAQPCRALLIGRGSQRFVKQFVERHPQLKRRLLGTGGLPAPEIANHLAACDLLVQPYLGGACTRRGTLMAGLGLGLPVISNTGPFSDSVFLESSAIETVPEDRWDLMAYQATKLLADKNRRQQLGDAAADLYRTTCSVERAVNSMRSYHMNSAA